MAVQSMTVDFIDRPRTQVISAAAYTLHLDVYVSGVLSPTPSATITIAGPGGGAMASPVTNAPVTVDGSGHMSYLLASGNTLVHAANYLATWSVTIGGVVYPIPQVFDVVRFPFINLVTTQDLINGYHFDLASSYGTDTSAENYIEKASLYVQTVINNKGRRPYLYLTPETFRLPIENLALAMYFRARVKSTDDRWDKNAKFHQGEYERWIATVAGGYDSDDSGSLDGTTQLSSQAGEDGRTLGFGWRI